MPNEPRADDSGAPRRRRRPKSAAQNRSSDQPPRKRKRPAQKASAGRPDSSDRVTKKRRKKKKSSGNREEGGTSRDPLGKPVAEYGVNLIGTLLGCGMIAAVGTGTLAYALTREPYSKIFLGVGGVIVLAGVAVFLMNIINVGRRLELRKHGLRYTVFGEKTELHWDDIVHVEVNRKDHTNYGVAGVYKESSDDLSPSGPLTNTEFDVTIHGRAGESIRLGPMFLKTVPDPKKLIRQIKMGAEMRQ